MTINCIASTRSGARVVSFTGHSGRIADFLGFLGEKGETLMDRINSAEPRRIILQQQLALVLQNIEAGVQRIVMQQEVIAKLGAGDHDTSAASDYDAMQQSLEK